MPQPTSGQLGGVEAKTKVGVGVMVMRGRSVLCARRKASHGAGDYAFPGGHLEYLESFEECARRECREEAGIEIENMRFVRLLNMKQYAPKHYVDIGLQADWKSGEPKNLEPEKFDAWGWYDIAHLPEPLFPFIHSYFEALRTGRNYFDA